MTGTVRAVAVGGIVGMIAGAIGGCATRAPAISVEPASAPIPRATAAGMAARADALRGAGRTDVIAAFGPATVVRFESGYEVWVYRYREPAAPGAVPANDAERSARETPPSELVLLLSPTGVVARVRVRSAGP